MSYRYKPRTQQQFDEEYGVAPSPKMRAINGGSCNDESCIVYCPKCNGRMVARIGRHGPYFHCSCTRGNPWPPQPQTEPQPEPVLKLNAQP